MYVDRESTVFSAPQLITHLLRQQHGCITLSPPSLRSIPGPLRSPHTAFYLVTDLPSEPIWTAPLPQRWALWACEAGLRGHRRFGQLRPRTPQASPSWPTLLPVLCGHLDGMTPFNPHQACLMGRAGLAGWALTSWAGWLWHWSAAGRTGGVACTPREERSVPVFLCHMLPSVCLYLLPVGSSEHKLASILFLRKPQGLGLWVGDSEAVLTFM